MYLDLTHTFTPDMPVFPGDPAAQLFKTSEISRDGILHYEIKTGMHVGTHMDAPAHMIEGGKLLSEFDASKFIARGHLADARGQSLISSRSLGGLDINEGDIVLVMTGWYKKFGQPGYYKNYPELGEDFVRIIINSGAGIVGLDTPSPDSAPYKIHKLLLAKNILIIENLTNLEELLYHKKFEVYALPVKFQAEAALARVIVKIIQ